MEQGQIQQQKPPLRKPSAQDRYKGAGDRSGVRVVLVDQSGKQTVVKV